MPRNDAVSARAPNSYCGCMAGTRPRRSRGSGTVRQLPSGSYQAIFKHDGIAVRTTVDTKAAAQGWLAKQRAAVIDGTWTPPAAERKAEPVEVKAPTFRAYAEECLPHRGLKPTTMSNYRSILDRHLLPKWGRRRLDTITVAEVKLWHQSLLVDKPTMRAQVYGLLRTILTTAYQDDLIPANPCRVRGAGSVKRATKTEIPTPAQVRELAEEMGITRNNDGSVRVLEHGKYKVMTLVSAWCGLRFGETTELRRKDIVMKAPPQTEEAPDPRVVPVVIKVRRGVTQVKGEFIVGPPKSDAGIRDVVIPQSIRDVFADYLATLPEDPEALVFPGSRSGEHMNQTSLYKPWNRTRANVGLPNLRWHDLRHFAGTTAAQTGATIAEVQGRLGHSTAQAAMRYQHAASGRDAQIAELLSRMAEPTDD